MKIPSTCLEKVPLAVLQSFWSLYIIYYFLLWHYELPFLIHTITFLFRLMLHVPTFYNVLHNLTEASELISVQPICFRLTFKHKNLIEKHMRFCKRTCDDD